MNILFYLHGECCPEVGGIERVTDILNCYFTSKGYNCFIIYQEKADAKLRRTKFVKAYYLPTNPVKEIAEIINNNEIDIIINQEEHYVTSNIFDAVKLSGRKCNIIFAYHNTPLEGAKASVGFGKIITSLKKEHRIQDLIKILCYPVYRAYNLNKIKDQYKSTLIKSDVNVMLANCYVDQWYKYAKVKYSQRNNYAPVISINNPLSFDTAEIEDNMDIKNKTVLILCRLYEPQKKILTALKIWREIEKDHRFDEWTLDIVGDGPDKNKYEEYASKFLKRANFYGRQIPGPFYNRSSIYMMTSSFEGWPMTLVEAMQYGCVPIVFDSFGSLHDVLQSEMSECIVEQGNKAHFIETLKYMMSNQEKRIELAKKSQEATLRFSKEQIGEKWVNLFKTLQ